MSASTGPAKTPRASGATGRLLGREGIVHHALLSLTLVLIAIQPLGTAAGGLYARLVLGFVIVVSVLAVYHRRRLFLIGVALGVPATVLVVLDPAGEPGSVGLTLAMATLSFASVSLLLRIFERPIVTTASVSSSLTVYLLLGIIWSLAYMLTELASPGSFYGLGEGGPAVTRRDLFYYSFVTLVTVGYGDIGPVSPEARALAITEAVVGQLYLVVLVASLVGMFLGEDGSASGGGQGGRDA
jgi:hypothetical protein